MGVAREKPVVLITNTVASEALAPLEGWTRVIQGPGNGDLMPRAAILEWAPCLSGIINQAELRIDRALLDAAPRLRIVANVAIGTDNLDLDLMTQRKVWASNTPQAFAGAAADCAMALYLCLARRIPECDRHVRSGAWRGFQPGRWDGVLLAGKTLGIIGYGAIGRAVARRARAFGMRVVYHNRTGSNHPAYRTLPNLLAESDFVSLHTPLNAESRHLMNTRNFGLMKSGAYLINLGRGKVVEEKALVKALQSGHLAGAALDVFENEPAVHPALMRMNNVVLTPHIGGGTQESRFQARLLCARNVAAVLQGKPPLTPVNRIGRVRKAVTSTRRAGVLV